MRKQIILIDEGSAYLFFGKITKTYTKSIPSGMCIPPLINYMSRTWPWALHFYISRLFKNINSTISKVR